MGKKRKPTNHSPFPSTSMPTLQQELITEIFSRLPAESLLRFRSLSKYWHAEISNSHFIKNHLTLSLNNKEYTHQLLMYAVNPELTLQSSTLNSLFYHNSTEAFDLDFPIKHNHSYKKWIGFRSNWILGSSNGLICLATGKNDLLIGNPSISEYKNLPDPRPQLLMKFVDSPIYSFGYDEFHDDYKVVGIFNDEVEIYSLKSDSWKNVDDCPSRVLLGGSGKFANGKFHWATTAAGLLPVYNGGDIVCFDLADEKWGKTVEPASHRGGDSVFLLSVLASNLSILCDYERTYLDVWVMKEYGVQQSWSIMFTIKCPGDDVQTCNRFHPLFFVSKRGEILVVFGSISMIYNPKDESIRYSKITNFDGYYEAEIHVESLVSPFPIEEPEDAMKNERLKKQDQDNPVTRNLK